MSGPLRARSVPEARLWIERQPCPGCGARGFQEPTRLVEQGEHLAVACRGYCPKCGAARAFEIALGEERVPPGAWGNGAPSTLIDAGEWMAMADTRASAVPEQPSTAALARARADLDAAIAALAEVAKFIPAGAEEPPPSAFFTSPGRQVYRVDPSRFARSRLEIVDEAWRELAARLAAQAPSK